MKKIIIFILMTIVSGEGFGQLPKNGATVKVNDIDLYYEVYGKGEPLLLLHGWTQSSQFWSTYIPKYAEHFEVYALDLRGHGRTSQLQEDFSIEKSAMDVLAFLDHLKLEKVKAIGLSFGGLTLLQLASVYPDKLTSMILIGAASNYEGGKNTETDQVFSYDNLPEAFRKELQATHHRGEHQIRALFDPNLNYKIELDKQTLNLIQAKALIVNGDRDEILGVDQAIALHKALPNSELWIVPNTGHVAITGPNQEDFLVKSIDFLTH